MSQEHYLEKIDSVPLSSTERAKKENELLTPEEHTAFRSCSCSLLWVCQTRIDIAHAVVDLQSNMVTPTVHHLKQVNALLEKAKKTATMSGLHFAPLSAPYRIVGYADSGHATKKTSYSYEGKLVLIQHDGIVPQDAEWMASTTARRQLEGAGHPIYFSARRATRVSHSASHAETLSAVGTSQIASLVAMRLTEVFAKTLLQNGDFKSKFARDGDIKLFMRRQYHSHVLYHGLRLSYIFDGAKNITYGKDYGSFFVLKPRDLIALQEAVVQVIAVDHVTDCMDLFELVTGARGVSSDKSQRVAILALREDRMLGRVRYWLHFPTRAMIADALTKDGLFPQMMHYCTSGIVKLPLLAEQFVRLRRRHGTTTYTEHELNDIDYYTEAPSVVDCVHRHRTAKTERPSVVAWNDPPATARA